MNVKGVQMVTVRNPITITPKLQMVVYIYYIAAAQPHRNRALWREY
jgi:hypothetical protein